MQKSLREDADYIVESAIKQVLPDRALERALENKNFGEGKIYVLAIGKAAWQMGKAAENILGKRIEQGIVITKYNHVKGEIPNMICFEAGHPVPDKNSFIATEAAIHMVHELNEKDTVLFLISGGGSALFELPLIEDEELSDITKQLLACGADIVEINTVRKRLSCVKGGKFAKLVEPAKIYSIVLSDILGDPLDMIASGPAYPDSSTCEDALKIVKKYNLKVSDKALTCLNIETPKHLKNVETVITGSVRELCRAAARASEELGYIPFILTEQLNCHAKDAGAFLASIAKTQVDINDSNRAFIVGGETIVELTGDGMGGRNQELALSAAEGISGLSNCAVFSIGSDGTDGPTDAAGGYVDGNTKGYLKSKGIEIYSVLQDNDSYHALEKTNGLIITGATGTNVNDVALLLIRKL